MLCLNVEETKKSATISICFGLGVEHHSNKSVLCGFLKNPLPLPGIENGHFIKQNITGLDYVTDEGTLSSDRQ